MRRVTLSRILHSGGLRLTACTALFTSLVVASWGSPATANATTGGPDIRGKVVISNWDSFDEDYTHRFGCGGEVTTVGQVLTVPAGMHTLKKFTFSWDGGGGSMVVRGEVYAWNGTMATGPALGESAPQTVGAGGWRAIKYRVDAAVHPGMQYIIFESIDKDYESCAAGTYAYPESPPGCDVFEQSNGGDESRWTTAGWYDFCGSMRMIVVLWHHH
jgi:hypothetical protein